MIKKRHLFFTQILFTIFLSSTFTIFSMEVDSSEAGSKILSIQASNEARNHNSGCCKDCCRNCTGGVGNCLRSCFTGPIEDGCECCLDCVALLITCFASWCEILED